MVFNIPIHLSHSCGIYSITNNHDNRFYIGSTICFRKRFSGHRGMLKKKKHANPYLQSFSNKYGIESLSFNLLYLCNNACLVFSEKYCIDTLKPQFNVKKIINRHISDEEVLFNNNLFLEQIKNIKTPFQNINIDLGKFLNTNEKDDNIELPF